MVRRLRVPRLRQEGPPFDPQKGWRTLKTPQRRSFGCRSRLRRARRPPLDVCGPSRRAATRDRGMHDRDWCSESAGVPHRGAQGLTYVTGCLVTPSATMLLALAAESIKPPVDECRQVAHQYLWYVSLDFRVNVPSLPPQLSSRAFARFLDDHPRLFRPIRLGGRALTLSFQAACLLVGYLYHLMGPLGEQQMRQVFDCHAGVAMGKFMASFLRRRVWGLRQVDRMIAMTRRHRWNVTAYLVRANKRTPENATSANVTSLLEAMMTKEPKDETLNTLSRLPWMSMTGGGRGFPGLQWDLPHVGEGPEGNSAFCRSHSRAGYPIPYLRRDGGGIHTGEVLKCEISEPMGHQVGACRRLPNGRVRTAFVKQCLL